MLAALAVVSALLAAPALATLELGHDGGLSSWNVYSKQKALEDVALKEVCYRNLYADLSAFVVKDTGEVLVEDTHKQTVFLSQGKLFDENNVEFLYEEFCYKQNKINSHNKDVQSVSGIQVGKRDLINTLGLNSLGSMSGFESGNGDQGATDAGLFSKGSFLNDFATYSPTQDDSFFKSDSPDSSLGGVADVKADPKTVDTTTVPPAGDATKDAKVPEAPKAPDAMYSGGMGQTASADGKSKRAWAWRRFLWRSAGTA